MFKGTKIDFFCESISPPYKSIYKKIFFILMYITTYSKFIKIGDKHLFVSLLIEGTLTLTYNTKTNI